MAKESSDPQGTLACPVTGTIHSTGAAQQCLNRTGFKVCIRDWTITLLASSRFLKECLNGSMDRMLSTPTGRSGPDSIMPMLESSFLT